MKILLLGANGNLGTQLANKLKDNCELFTLESNQFDFSSRENILSQLKNIGPSVVINTMAYNAVDECETSDDAYRQAEILNIDLPKNLAEACRQIDAVLVHYTSDYIFGGYEPGEDLEKYIKQGGFQEDDLPKTNSRYSETKLKGEEAILEFAKKGLKYYIIRTSKLFGPKGKSEYAKPSFFDIMLDLSQKKDELQIVDAEMSCFTYTPDLADLTAKLITEDNSYGIYHVVNEGACTWYEGAKDLFQIAGVDIKTTPVEASAFPRPAKRPTFSVLKNTKLAKLRNYQDALKEYLNK